MLCLTRVLRAKADPGLYGTAVSFLRIRSLGTLANVLRVIVWWGHEGEAEIADDRPVMFCRSCSVQNVTGNPCQVNRSSLTHRRRQKDEIER